MKKELPCPVGQSQIIDMNGVCHLTQQQQNEEFIESLELAVPGNYSQEAQDKMYVFDEEGEILTKAFFNRLLGIVKVDSGNCTTT